MRAFAGRPEQLCTQDRQVVPGAYSVGCIPCEGSVGGSEGDKGQGSSGGQGRPHLRASATDPSWALRSTCTVRWGPLDSSLPSGKPAAEKYS